MTWTVYRMMRHHISTMTSVTCWTPAYLSGQTDGMVMLGAIFTSCCHGLHTWLLCVGIPVGEGFWLCHHYRLRHQNTNSGFAGIDRDIAAPGLARTVLQSWCVHNHGGTYSIPKTYRCLKHVMCSLFVCTHCTKPTMIIWNCCNHLWPPCILKGKTILEKNLHLTNSVIGIKT